ncbi:hypothetical protein CY34DRAFT_511629 [Suillus luteus UH-Slu-Lm8-n1]|uniref:Uncharacterized protein n=1 Tax=Suillus luteus UH-Slu-Lm8-n1 TaxID=930992 RepID=A0A0C9ZGA1_9AGAM|nr:hypothetical protein CY34DRAFT_511629 [Suillus luteus UH-Slu-Lm8-n1]
MCTKRLTGCPWPSFQNLLHPAFSYFDVWQGLDFSYIHYNFSAPFLRWTVRSRPGTTNEHQCALFYKTISLQRFRLSQDHQAD